LAIAIPQGRSVSADYMKAFAAQATSSGLLQKIIEGAGLRGTAKNNSGDNK
jgi:hypothetical protein